MAVEIVGDAIPASLTGQPGDPARGLAIVSDRAQGLCVLCHSGPFRGGRAGGDLSPDLAGVGGRLSNGQIRLRIVDPRRLNPETIMPPYFASDGLVRVSAAWNGRTILSAGAVEDVVAHLGTRHRRSHRLGRCGGAMSCESPPRPASPSRPRALRPAACRSATPPSAPSRATPS